MHHLFPFLLISFVLPALAEKPVAPTSISGTERVSAEQVVELILSDPELVIVDARRAEEHAKGHVEGAISLLDTDITAKTLRKHIKDVMTPVLFYCNGERCLRSTHACRKAVAAGYQRVYWFRGGWMEWVEKELPVAR